MLAIALAVASAACAVFLDWRFNPGSLLRGKVSASSFFLYLYLVLYLGGGVYLYLATTQNATFLASLIIGLLVPPILLALLTGGRLNAHPAVEGTPRQYGRLTRPGILLVLLVASTGIAVYLYQAGVPLLALLQGATSDEVRAMRSAAKFGFRFAYVFHGLYALLHVISLLTFIRLLRGPSPRRVGQFALLLIGTTFVYLASSEKAPMLFYWVSIGMTYVIERGSFRIPKSAKIVLGSAFVGYVLVITMATYGYSTFSEAIGLVISRVFVYQVMSPAVTYDIVPGSLDFLYGRSYHLPSFLVSDRFSLEGYLYYVIFNGIGSGNAPPGVMANAYANFGFLASVGEYVFVLLAFFWLEARFARSRDEVSIACRAWLTQYVAMVIFAGSSAAVLLSPDLIFVVLFYLVLTATLRSPVCQLERVLS